MEKQRIIFLPLPERRGKLLMEIYELIGGKLLPDGTDGIVYNCARVEIAADIQDGIYEAYRQRYPDEYARTPRNFETQVTMLLANSGPKADHTLPAGHVRVLPSFLLDKDEHPIPNTYIDN